MFGKRLAMLIITVVSLMAVTCVPANALTLNVNGNYLDCYAENGISYTSVRRFAELYGGYDVEWDQGSKVANISGNGLDLDVYLGRYYSVANDRVLMRDGINTSRDGRVYAPVTVLAEAVGARAVWEPSTDSVVVSGGGAALTHGTSYYNSEDLYWLSRIIQAESGGESFMGKCAVGNVVLNRVADPQYPSTVKGVIFDTKYGVQFTPSANGTIYNTPSEESVLAAKACLDGFSRSDKILYFLNPRIAQSNWIVNNKKYMFTIGNHDFYA
ncbi:MAG: copper amine oxidase [Ruminococcaceae bacterium]|nr:copper amine oxidase [Oscillospiraceae bacterium]